MNTHCVINMCQRREEDPDPMASAYLDGYHAAEEQLVEFLESITPDVIDDWGLNSIGNVIDWIKSGKWGEVLGWDGTRAVMA
jgi:hypothetical protein